MIKNFFINDKAKENNTNMLHQGHVVPQNIEMPCTHLSGDPCHAVHIACICCLIYPCSFMKLTNFWSWICWCFLFMIFFNEIYLCCENCLHVPFTILIFEFDRFSRRPVSSWLCMAVIWGSQSTFSHLQVRQLVVLWFTDWKPVPNVRLKVTGSSCQVPANHITDHWAHS